MKAVAGVAATAAVASAAAPVAGAAPPGVKDVDFFVVNDTAYELMLVSYTTGNPYPEYVKPDPSGPPNESYSRVPPGGKFTIGLRWTNADQTQKINFDMKDLKTGNRFAGGQVILKLENTTVFGHDYGQYAGCWGGPGRTCSPLAGPTAMPPTNTVTFSG